MNYTVVLDRDTAKVPMCTIGSGSLLRRYETRRQGKDIETKIRELETQFDSYTKAILKSLLSAKEIEEITRLSEASLQNVLIMKRLAKQIQEASEKE